MTCRPSPPAQPPLTLGGLEHRVGGKEDVVREPARLQDWPANGRQDACVIESTVHAQMLWVPSQQYVLHHEAGRPPCTEG